MCEGGIIAAFYGTYESLRHLDLHADLAISVLTTDVT